MIFIILLVFIALNFTISRKQIGILTTAILPIFSKARVSILQNIQQPTTQKHFYH